MPTNQTIMASNFLLTATFNGQSVSRYFVEWSGCDADWTGIAEYNDGQRQMNFIMPSGIKKINDCWLKGNFDPYADGYFVDFWNNYRPNPDVKDTVVITPLELAPTNNPTGLRFKFSGVIWTGLTLPPVNRMQTTEVFQFTLKWRAETLEYV